MTSRLLSALAFVSFVLAPAAVAAQVPTPVWRSGFETGFPGEWLDYDGGAYTVSGTPNPA